MIRTIKLNVQLYRIFELAIKSKRLKFSGESSDK